MSDQPDIEVIDRYSAWYGFDTENDKTGKVTLAALVSERGEKTIWHKAGHLIDWCERQQKNPVVICHNLEYDLVNEYGDQYSNLMLTYLKGRLIMAKHGRVTFLDSFNHFRMSLAEIGEALGFPKLKMDIYSEEYVAQDAWICLKVMVDARDYIASLGGRIGATAGSSSVSVWRAMTEDEFLTGPIDSKWLRSGYYGGRTEIFREYAEGDIRGYDINSMYPFCMLNEFPEYCIDDPTLIKGKGMAEVTISIPHDLFVAPLVHRTKEGRLVYPVGVIRGTWTYDEIRYAESLGAKVLTVHKALGGNVMIRPFNDFIHTLYGKRKQSDSKPERLFLKVLMNSLYGKVSSKNVITRTVSKYNLIKNGSKRLDQVKWINSNRGLLDYNTPPQPYVNMIWGSMITAYSRILLTKYLTRVPPEQLIYCDTDSVYVNGFSFDESTELGAMKLEKKTNKVRVLQPKVYQLGDEEFVAKGVPRPRESDNGLVIDFAREFIESGTTSFMAPIRFRQSINSKRGRANQWINVTKSMRTVYANKISSHGRYFPPVIGEQLELFQSVKRTKRKEIQKGK